VEADDTQTREADMAERRRSPRILREIAIRLDGDGRSCTALTAVINRHGAMVLAPVAFPEEAVLDLSNLENDRSARCRVVWCAESEGGHKLGVELVGEVDVWADRYDPRPDEM
jgi:PilZ domain